MLAFVSVILFAASVSILATASITRNRFAKYALASDIEQAQSLARPLFRYYQQNTGWINLEQLLVSEAEIVGNMSTQMSASSMMRGMMGMQSSSMMMWMPPASRAVVADTSGTVVADTDLSLTGETYADGRLQSGVEIGADGEVVGYIFVGSMIDIELGPLERDYIQSVALTVLVIVGIAAVAAFLFSSTFIARIMAPIHKVMSAADAIASGELSARVNMARTDEIGILAGSFNKMGMALEEGENNRQQLIADIAHELRTPLSLIRGNLEAILDGVYPLEKDSIASVYEETLLLGELVNDLRELSLLDAGELRLELETIDARELVRRAARVFEHESLKQDISLRSAAGDTSQKVIADKNKIHQVLCNLISNAIRHTPSDGVVTVGIEQIGDGSSSGYTRLFVEDTGPGMSNSERKQIFERFYRTDASRSRATGGSGLGLAISKKIVEAHGGTIGVDWSNACGSRFSFSLPRHARSKRL